MISRLVAPVMAALIALYSASVFSQSSAPVSSLQTIKDRGTLIVGTAANMPPMNNKLLDGTLQGFDMDLAKLMADVMEVKVEFKVMPFDHLITAVQKGEVDMVISNMTITPERNTHVAFVGPYVTSGKCLITTEETLAKASKDQVNKTDYTLAVMKGTTTEEFVKVLIPNAKRLNVESVTDGVNAVLAGKASAMVSEFQTCALITNQYQGHGFVTSFSALSYEPIGIAVNGNDAHLINWTENTLLRLDQLGLIKLLAQKWLGDMVQLQAQGAQESSY